MGEDFKALIQRLERLTMNECYVSISSYELSIIKKQINDAKEILNELLQSDYPDESAKISVWLMEVE
jgi:hypothetical protein